MKLAIQEHLLQGASLLERIEQAQLLGFDGLEFNAAGLTEHVPYITEVLELRRLRASGVYVGGTHLLHPDYATRDEAIVIIRQAMANALDLGALGVIFTSHHATTPRMPDLHPYKSSSELEGEFLVKQLRTTLCDLAYAMGADLYLAPMNRYETHLIRKLSHAATIMAHNDEHPHLKIAANTFHMAMEEDNLLDALKTHAQQIGYVYLADHNRRLPGQGMIDFKAVIEALKAGGYDGWLTLACDVEDMDALKSTVKWLKQML